LESKSFAFKLRSVTWVWDESLRETGFKMAATINQQSGMLKMNTAASGL
jgi:O-succinylbenzoate synthase